jgi:hypothetical protein
MLPMKRGRMRRCVGATLMPEGNEEDENATEL